MKKFLVLSVLLCAVTVCAFAQSYTVQSVSGRVQRESGSSRVDVKAGDTLTAQTVIITGAGASLVLKEGTRTFTVPAAKNGTVAELATAAGIRIGGNIVRTDTEAVTRTTGQTSTASARASEAAQDEDIAAE